MKTKYGNRLPTWELPGFNNIPDHVDDICQKIKTLTESHCVFFSDSFHVTSR